MKAKKLRSALMRWHRRLGIFSFLVLILLCVSGFLLNHSHQLGLDSNAVKSRTLLSLYGIDVPQFEGVKVGNNWVGAVDRQLFLNRQALGECEERFIGALLSSEQELWILACEQEIQIFTIEGELVEKLGPEWGLPVPISKLGLCNNMLCLISNGQLYSFDQLSLNIELVKSSRADIDLNFVSLNSEPLPNDLQLFYQNQFAGSELNWQRLIQDIHAGRFLGVLGPWVLDIFTLIFLVISGTGFYLWFSQSRKKNKKRRMYAEISD